MQILTAEPLFEGTSEIDQLQKIFGILGRPTKERWPDYDTLPNAKTFQWKESLKPRMQVGRGRRLFVSVYACLFVYLCDHVPPTTSRPTHHLSTHPPPTASQATHRPPTACLPTIQPTHPSLALLLALAGALSEAQGALVHQRQPHDAE